MRERYTMSQCQLLHVTSTLFIPQTLVHSLTCVCVCVPVVGVVGLSSAPPHVRIVLVLLAAVGRALGLRGTAHKLHPPEAVDAAGQQHPVVMEIHGSVSAGLGGGTMGYKHVRLCVRVYVDNMHCVCVCVCVSDLLGHSVPVQVSLTLVHALLVPYLKPLTNHPGIAHQLPNSHTCTHT